MWSWLEWIAIAVSAALPVLITAVAAVLIMIYFSSKNGDNRKSGKNKKA